jgi:hypothetical protein
MARYSWGDRLKFRAPAGGRVDVGEGEESMENEGAREAETPG